MSVKILVCVFRMPHVSTLLGTMTVLVMRAIVDHHALVCALYITFLCGYSSFPQKILMSVQVRAMVVMSMQTVLTLWGATFVPANLDSLEMELLAMVYEPILTYLMLTYFHAQISMSVKYLLMYVVHMLYAPILLGVTCALVCAFNGCD